MSISRYYAGNFIAKFYFTGTWFPELQRWCLLHRPNDLMSCNTNNGTERINGDLKHNELDLYRNCTLSELLEVIIVKFLPKLYRKYVSLNVKFSSAYKKYTPGIPRFLNDRPRSLVLHLLDKLQKVTTEMMESASETNGEFIVESDQPGIRDDKQKYVVAFGDKNNTCRCSCRDFRRTRLLCKHIFAVIQSGKRGFQDLSVLFLHYPFTNLDPDLFGEIITVEGSGAHQDNETCNDDGELKIKDDDSNDVYNDNKDYDNIGKSTEVNFFGPSDNSGKFKLSVLKNNAALLTLKFPCFLIL